MTLLDRLDQFIRERALLRGGERILVAVSGGPDSVVLLDLLWRMRKSWKLSLVAGHFNHQLRGADADADEAFVQSLCQSRVIRYRSGRAPVRQYSREHRLSIEQAARECRYEFLDRMADEEQCDAIATGHNADDQAETVLDRLLRGSGIRGLGGIPVRRGRVIRPLLFATRVEIGAYAETRALDYCLDETNRDMRYRRNRIRHQLLPILARGYNPLITTRLNRLSEIMQEVDRHLQVVARAGLEHCLRAVHHDKIILDCIEFLAYFTTVQKYILELAMVRLSGVRPQLSEHDFRTVLAMVKRRGRGRSIILQRQWRLTVSGGEFCLARITSGPGERIIEAIPARCRLWTGQVLEIKPDEISLEEVRKRADSGTQWIDLERIKMPLTVRSVRSGDRFHPLHSPGRKKVSDLLIDSKTPLHRRMDVPILECASGIIWVCGYRLDDRFKITEKSAKVLQLSLSQDLESTANSAHSATDRIPGPPAGR